MGGKNEMATSSENWTFLVYNLPRRRTHFRKSETIHPFSKSNHGKSNLEGIWLGTWKNRKPFYDRTVIMQNRKQTKPKQSN